MGGGGGRGRGTETSDREVSADVAGKERQENRENGAEKQENRKREGGKLNMEGLKSYKKRRGLFLFVFFLFVFVFFFLLFTFQND